MLLLIFGAGKDRYAVDARDVSEVIPRVPLRPVPHAPASLAGHLDYGGRAIPVIDFSVLVGEPPGRDALSTRIILIERGGRGHHGELFGLIAENVSHVEQVEPEHVVSAPLNLGEAPYLGPLVRVDNGLVQVLAVAKLLPASMTAAILGSEATPP